MNLQDLRWDGERPVQVDDGQAVSVFTRDPETGSLFGWLVCCDCLLVHRVEIREDGTLIAARAEDPEGRRVQAAALETRLAAEERAAACPPGPHVHEVFRDGALEGEIQCDGRAG